MGHEIVKFSYNEGLNFKSIIIRRKGELYAEEFSNNSVRCLIQLINEKMTDSKLFMKTFILYFVTICTHGF